ncbi:hypothetical protein QYF36_007776 [Acer negundo]|nr:hypothetical protein QYF36_007776 [Acer negundo]
MITTTRRSTTTRMMLVQQRLNSGIWKEMVTAAHGTASNALQQPDLKNLVEKLTNLKVLALSSVNNISSSQLEVLTNFSSLNFLSLRFCELEGQIPSEMLELSQLEYLDLSWNGDSLGNLLKLRQTGGLRSLVDKLTNLKWLDLGYVNISSPLPDSLGNLSSLTHLSLRSCQLQGN